MEPSLQDSNKFKPCPYEQIYTHEYQSENHIVLDTHDMGRLVSAVVLRTVLFLAERVLPCPAMWTMMLPRLFLYMTKVIRRGDRGQWGKDRIY